ncbi:MAG TPA: energy transducer TonB [Steroidobacteraceae bacterium]|nr:energy transducer TonB [Steroidobacteraceae bacterium]
MPAAASLPKSTPSASPAPAAPPAPRPAGANVIVLSADPALIDLLRDSLAGTHRVWRADDVSHAADLMVAAGNAVFLVDASLADHDSRDLVNRVHKQFPDLAIIVAGRREDEAVLAPLVSSGVIFRFLHKPASAERIRNFVDATQRRAHPVSDLPAAAARTAASTAITGTHQTIEHAILEQQKLEQPRFALPKLKLDPAVVRRWSRRSLLLIPLMLAAWGIAEWRPWEKVTDLLAGEEAAPAAAVADAGQDPRVQRLLDLAGIALSQGKLVEPPGDNALEHYRGVLASDPGNRVAQRGIESVADELLVQAERALMEQDLTRLASAVDAARSARPDHPRLAFFRLQLERELARQGSEPNASGAAARREAGAVASQTAQRVQSLVQLANDRIRANRLVGSRDSAHTHVLAARKLDPADPGVQQTALALSALLQKNIALAIRENRLDEAGNLANLAAALNVNPREISALRTEIEAARVANVRTERAKLLVLANQRIAQGRLLEPAGDSARHYLDQLRAADPAFDGLPDTTALFATRALTDARALAAAGYPDRAETMLRAAGDSGAPASEVAAITTEIAAARSLREAAARRAQVLPESALKRTKVVAPTYPQRALEKGTEGWVDVEFTLAADGSVRDAAIKASEPAGTFDRAALNAVERWRYEPYLVNGAVTEPRVSARLRFEIKD